MIQKFDEFLNEGHSREIISELIQISNNSRMTQEMAEIFANKLDDVEFRKLKEWLKLAKSHIDIKVHNAEKKFRLR